MTPNGGAANELRVPELALPKGGGAIRGLGESLGTVGALGTASFSVPLPVTAGRGFAPALALGYASGNGNGLFGIGFGLGVPTIERRTTKGVPTYDAADVFLAPDGMQMAPELGEAGDPSVTTVTSFRGQPLPQRFQTTRYLSEGQSNDRIERWCGEDGTQFWIVHGADGIVNIFGRSAAARIADPHAPDTRIARWLLEEQLAPNGERIHYHYKAEDGAGVDADADRERTVQRYLSRVCYGPGEAGTHPLLIVAPEALTEVAWHFELVFDYGERSTALDTVPDYAETSPWPVRADPFSDYRTGFEVRTWRLCRQVLMFHRFVEELGDEPVLVSRLLPEYDENPVMTRLKALHRFGYGRDRTSGAERGESLPPLEFDYVPFQPLTGSFEALTALTGLHNGQRYQLIDLFGEGLPGMLYRDGAALLYRAPERSGQGGDAVVYGPWRPVDPVPMATGHGEVQPTLSDMSGDGRLDWLVASPGLSGVFSLGPDRNWSDFVPFAAFPPEFFDPQAMMADLVGDGLPDLVLIGPRSVRLYPNRRLDGFGNPVDVGHTRETELPLPDQGRTHELLAFSDVLGSGQQHLVRVRHDEVVCWPNLGHGRFGDALVLARLPFAAERFDPQRIYLADLDGSGAADLIYVENEQLVIFHNQSGNGFAAPRTLAWPPGVRFDELCQLNFADVMGRGCASLVLSAPHTEPRHWHYDFCRAGKPYLLRRSNNNLGLEVELSYRSSAQEWLDEKQETPDAVSNLPLAVHVLSQLSQSDEISGNRLQQHYRYRRGYYDGLEREFCGFGLVVATDTPVLTEARGTLSLATAPLLTKSWYWCGHPEQSGEDRSAYYSGDGAAFVLGPTLFTRFDEASQRDEPLTDLHPDTHREMLRALRGSPLRAEIYGLDGAAAEAHPYSVTETRYMLRLEQDGQGRHRSVTRRLALEVLSYTYERAPVDPRSQHDIALQWDRFGSPVLSVNASYPRRANPQALYQDDQQYQLRLIETRQEWLHLTDPQAWRLGLAAAEGVHALTYEAEHLAGRALSYERLWEPEGLLAPERSRELLGTTDWTYCQADGATPGWPSLAGLVSHGEVAEFTASNLAAFDGFLEGEERAAWLRAAGYRPRGAVWTMQGETARYQPLIGFHKMREHRASGISGPIAFTYDPYWCGVVAVTDALGQQTRADYDYRYLTPIRLIDINDNVREVLYDTLGRVRATSIYGTEDGKEVGFAPVTAYSGLETLEAALADPARAIESAASAIYYAPFSWMGQVLPDALASKGGLSREAAQTLFAELVEACLLTPAGHVRARARWAPLPKQFPHWVGPLLTAADRVPAHAAVLVADRYPGDPEGQMRIDIAYSDGFGRVVQSKRKVPSGLAFAADAGRRLAVEDGTLRETPASTRWAVSGRVEYDHKGLPVRNWHPYFIDTHQFVDDAALREHGYCDTHVYDPKGRQIQLINAAGYEQRWTFTPWYQIFEDENDTAAERALPRARLS